MISHTRRQMIVAAAGAALGGTVCAQGQTIKMVVGFTPGGNTDTLARLAASGLGSQLNRPVVVENRAGASGNIATRALAAGRADGSELLFVPSTHAINASLYKNLPFDTERDFAAVGMIAASQYVLVVHPDIAARNVEELVALLKAQPGHFSYAASSLGTSNHLAAELFKMMSATEMTGIYYKGSLPALPDVMAGRTPIMFDSIMVVLPHIRSNRLRALAVTGSQRSALLPEVPTVAETPMFDGYEVKGWYAVLAPAKTPRPVVEQFNAALNAAINTPAFLARLDELGVEAMPGTTTMADAFIRDEIVRWGELVRTAKIAVN